MKKITSTMEHPRESGIPKRKEGDFHKPGRENIISKKESVPHITTVELNKLRNYLRKLSFIETVGKNPHIHKSINTKVDAILKEKDIVFFTKGKNEFLPILEKYLEKELGNTNFFASINNKPSYKYFGFQDIKEIQKKLQDLLKNTKTPTPLLENLVNSKELTPHVVRKMTEVYYILELYTWTQHLIYILPKSKQNRGRELLEDGKMQDFISFFNAEADVFFGIGINIQGKEIFERDHNFPVTQEKIGRMLPNDKFTSKLLQNDNLGEEIINLHFLKPNKYTDRLGTTYEKNDMIIFPQMSSVYFGKTNHEETKDIFQTAYSNEAMHLLLDNLGFKAEKELNDLGTVHDVFSGKETKLNNLFIHEFLSDYSSLSKQSIDLKRIISFSLNESFNQVFSQYQLTKPSGYEFTARFSKNIIEKILGKSINSYLTPEVIGEFEPLYSNKDIHTFNKQFNAKVYMTLIPKVIKDLEETIYNGMNGIEYLLTMYKKQGVYFMKKIYKWKQEQ